MTLLLALTGQPLQAQSEGTIQGTVLDAQGATVAGAKVTVRNLATALERSAVTDTSGIFSFPALPAGKYRIEIRKDGFQTLAIGSFTLDVATVAAKNYTLQVGQVAETMEVTTEAPVVEAATMTVGQVINQNTVQDIPLNGRHFVDLALLIPGTVTPPQNGFLTAPLRGQGSFAYNTAGNREDAINFMINGINLNDMVQNQVTFQPTINTISEFRIDNSTYSAEYGRNSGSIVNIDTRSGSNEFHGEAYEYLRNEFFDARNAFNPTTVTSGGVTSPNHIAPFKRNQFGGDFGGPIKKKSTYFFLSYEGLKQRQGLTLSSLVFPDNSPNPATITRATIQAAGNAVPIALLGLVPHANTTVGISPVANAFTGSAVAPVDINQGTADLSHNFGDNDRLHGYYVYQHDLRKESGAGTSIPGFGDTREGKRQVLTVNETHIFSPNLVNEVRLGANRIHITFIPNNATDPASLGLSTTLGPTETFMPTISVGNLGLLFGDERQFSQGRGDMTFVGADTLSYIRGRHAFKFGGEFRDFRNNNFNGDPGQLIFNTDAHFQAATVDSAARTLGNVANRLNEGALDFFAQDSWKLKSYFTLELGLRYSWNMTPSEAKNRFATFDPATASLLLVSQPYAQNNKNFQPRVGFAWDMFHSGKTVLRAGYGFLVDEPVSGFILSLNSNPPFALPISVLANPISGLAAIFNSPTPSNLALSTIDPNFKNADVQDWNLNIQQQVTPTIGIMVGYFGSKGTHLEIERNINQFKTLGMVSTRPFTALTAAPSPIPPGTSLGNILTKRSSDSNSNYNALWISANKRFSQSIQFNASYTWSHSIDDVSRNNNGIVVQDSTNIFGSRGNSDFDARHRFVMNAIYDLPFKGNRLVSGWEIAPIISAQSGNPFTVVVPSGAITGLGNTVTPIVVGPVSVTGNPFGQWIAPVCTTPTICTFTGTFSIPTTTLGNLGRNSIVGPGFTDVDLGIIKNTKLTERINVQFRADAFDLLNHPNYGQPARVLSAVTGSTVPNLFRITNTRFPTGDSGSSRQLQLALKFIF